MSHTFNFTFFNFTKIAVIIYRSIQIRKNEMEIKLIHCFGTLIQYCDIKWLHIGTLIFSYINQEQWRVKGALDR